MGAGRAGVTVARTDPVGFREAMSSFATGVTVVTVGLPEGGGHGMTVNAFASVSLDPVLVMVCLARSSRGLTLIENAGAFAVNVLSSRQEQLSRWFADPCRPASSAMFDRVLVELGETGSPLLSEAAAVFDCRLHGLVPGGDHVIVLGEVVSFEQRPQSEPLVFHDGRYRSLAREQDPALTRPRLAPGS